MVVKKEEYFDSKIIEWYWASDNELIPSPFFTSCYLIDGLLIDSGAPAGSIDLKNFIISLNDKNMVRKCVITHSHEDHAGGAHMLQNEFNIPIYASKKAVQILKEGYGYPQYRKITWGECLKPVDAQEIGNTIATTSENYTFNVFPMPGHSPDLIALLEKNKQWAFVSDAVQPRYKMLFGNNSNIQEDIIQIYESVEKLYNITKEMNELKIFVSGQGLFEGREYLKERLHEINHLHHKAHLLFNQQLKKGTERQKALKRVLKKIFKRETVIGKLTGEDLSTMNLVKQLVKWPLNKQ
jgi:glyoxylase-like metal-dependent hydrolase (beta-lactamase superfamily II)